MAKFTIQRFVAIVVFFILIFLFFYWLVVQARDMAYFFGFSTSEVVAGDIVGLGNTLGGVVGNVELSHRWESVGFSGKTNAVYDLLFDTKILCVKQLSEQFASVTTDCTSFFYPVAMPDLHNVELINILFRKVFDADQDLIIINVQKVQGAEE